VLDDVINSVESSVDEEFEGRVRIVIAYTRDYDIGKPFNEVLSELMETLGRRRFGVWRKLIVDGKDLCGMCGMPTAKLVVETVGDEKLGLCSFCHYSHRVGTVSRRLGFIAELRDSSKYRDCDVVDVVGVKYAICLGDTHADLQREYIHYSINEFQNPILNASNVGYSVLFLNSKMPTNEETGEILTLDNISDYAISVKADANKMGYFKAKAAEDGASYLLFSTLLSTVFDAYSSWLFTRNIHRYGDRVFVIYSGGDDAFLIGDYRALDLIANIIRRAGEFGINVAAGALIHEPQEPIYLIWGETDERLEETKRVNRDDSLIYLAHTGNAPIILRPSDVLEVTQYIDYKATAPSEEEDTIGRSLIFKMGEELTSIYNTLYTLYTLGQEGRCGLMSGFIKELIRSMVNYTYLVNRNKDRAETIISNLSRDIEPSRLTNLLMPILGIRDCSQYAKSRELMELTRLLAKVIMKINIQRLNRLGGVSR
jgi:CRISPR-associated protein Csm1